MSEQHHDEPSPLQGYYDWQVNTLMLAYDLQSPLVGGDDQAHMQRRMGIEQEVRELTLAVVPDVYKNDPELDWPPAVMMDITRATLYRAAQIAGVVES
jgi:hypothetical protein